MTGFVLRSAVFALALTAPASTLNATTIERFDLQQLTENAFCIFNGVCQSVEGIVVDGRITTRYVFTVQHVLKGELDDREISFSFPGGVVGRSRSHIVGMPEFQQGEETVLFLTHPDRNGALWPVGLAQGKFLVDRGREGGEPPQVFHSAATSALTLLQTTSAAKVADSPLPDLNGSGLPLSEFLSAVRTLVTGAAAPERQK